MYEHRFLKPSNRTIREVAVELAEQMAALHQQGRFVETVALFTKAVPPIPTDALSNEQYEGAAYYHLALISHWAQRFDDARRFMELSGLPAGGDFGLLLYHDRLAIAERLAAHQDCAISAGKPAILFTALPKSASAFVSNSIAQILDVPVFRASVGGIVSGWVVRKWAAQINRGGATTHEHYPALTANIDALVQAGVRKVFVQVRDPRAAWWSYFHHINRRPDIAKESPGPHQWYSEATMWLQGWIDASRAPGCPLKVVFVRYDDVRLKPMETIKLIVDESCYSLPMAEMARFFEKRRQSGRALDNFRVGEPDEWRRGLAPDLAAQFWRNTPEPVRDLLQMAE